METNNETYQLTFKFTEGLVNKLRNFIEHQEKPTAEGIMDLMGLAMLTSIMKKENNHTIIDCDKIEELRAVEMAKKAIIMGIAVYGSMLPNIEENEQTQNEN